MEPPQPDTEVWITRERLHKRPAPGGFAWQWLYSVHVPGERYAFTGEGIGWARGTAKRHGNGRLIVETWK